MCSKMILLIMVLIYAPNIAVAELPLQFLDFMEFWSSLIQNCGETSNFTGQIQQAFSKCLSRIPSGNYELAIYNYCNNTAEYIKCWENVSLNMKQNCSTKTTPGLYKSNLQGFCKADNGKETMNKFNDAINKFKNLTISEQNDCKATGEHWMIACQDLMKDMISSDLCIRHTGMKKCFARFTCEKNPVTNFYKSTYQDSKAFFNCQ